MIVVDASVVVTALGDDGDEGGRARARLSGQRLFAPELIDLEAVSAWRRLCAAGLLGADRAEAAVADLEALPLARAPHRPLVRRCWELRGNATVYDAVYVALAERLAAPLVTSDRRLAGLPGARCRFEVVA